MDNKVKQNGLPNGKARKEVQQAEKKKEQKTEQKTDGQKSKQKTLAGGVVVEDLRPGKGPEARPNKSVTVFYEGRLKTNNKVFDSTKSGAGFKFTLGRGNVIKGWEIGGKNIANYLIKLNQLFTGLVHSCLFQWPVCVWEASVASPFHQQPHTVPRALHHKFHRIPLWSSTWSCAVLINPSTVTVTSIFFLHIEMHLFFIINIIHSNNEFKRNDENVIQSWFATYINTSIYFALEVKFLQLLE